MRRETSRWPALLSVVMALWLIASALGLLPTAASTLDVTISGVRATNVRDTTFTVSWVTNQSAAGEVHYGTDPANLNRTAYDSRGTGTSDDTHYVTLLGLTPNTLYYFDVVSDGTTDDNGGAHYTVTTGPTLDLPASDTIYGKVLKADGTTPAEGTIVYIRLFDDDGNGSPGQAAELSSLVDNSGYWYTNLGNARTTDLSGYFSYSASGDGVELIAQGAGDGMAGHWIDTANDRPAPPMVLTCPDFVEPWGTVEIADVQFVAARWRQPAAGQPYDLDGDGIVTVVDIMLVVVHWGEQCAGDYLFGVSMFNSNGVAGIASTGLGK